MNKQIQKTLQNGTVLPAHPLALDADRRLDERRQRALSRYYIAAGAGGLAVGVHTTQFAIREPKHGLYSPVLKIAADEMDRADENREEKLVRVAGICGKVDEAVAEAQIAADLGYHAGLLNLSATRDAGENEVFAHCLAVSEVIPVFGFFINPTMGGRELPYSFWRRFADIDHVVAIKIACFDRYKTIDVVRAIAESGRDDIALYTGNDDNIVLDLLTPFRFQVNGETVERRIVGGLLGHWAVWTRAAVELHATCRELVASGAPISPDMLALANQVTDANAALFDPSHNYAGCISGVMEVLRRQGLLEGNWCLNPKEVLSEGQSDEIDRVIAAYPHMLDDAFVEAHRETWLSDYRIVKEVKREKG